MSQTNLKSKKLTFKSLYHMKTLCLGVFVANELFRCKIKISKISGNYLDIRKQNG